jgi:hypothetical protein
LAWAAAASNFAPVSSAASAQYHDEHFNAVACFNSATCHAIGQNFFSPPYYDTLSERWNGHSWRTEPTAVPSYIDNALNAVSCPSGNVCYGAGWYTASYQTLIERWNGASWKVVKTPQVGQLGGIACPSVSVCFALGQDVILKLAGTRFVRMTAPNPPVDIVRTLTSISCTSTKFCMSVGNDGGNAPVVERWDGKHWSVLKFSSPAAPYATQVNAVSCLASSSCLVAGEYGTNSGAALLIEQWNGKKWHNFHVPAPTPFAKLDAVACASGKACFAIASYNVGISGNTESAIEAWNGVKWTIALKVKQKGWSGSILNGITCPSSSTCFAVGDSQVGNGEQQAVVMNALVEKWNGRSWTISPSPNA